VRERGRRGTGRTGPGARGKERKRKSLTPRGEAEGSREGDWRGGVGGDGKATRVEAWGECRGMRGAGRGEGLTPRAKRDDRCVIRSGLPNTDQNYQTKQRNTSKLHQIKNSTTSHSKSKTNKQKKQKAQKDTTSNRAYLTRRDPPKPNHQTNEHKTKTNNKQKKQRPTNNHE